MDQRVVVTDVEMKFGSMVMFMVKWTIASIPAFLILAALLWVLVIGSGLALTAMFPGLVE